jgi:hypothetical protein
VQTDTGVHCHVDTLLGIYTYILLLGSPSLAGYEPSIKAFS